ncbi:MAG: hypothetical protein Q7S89_03520 [bacterium]|nr:hypothetical protein [bacterium]
MNGKDQRGAILIIALLILGLLLASGVAISSMLLRALRSTRQSGDGFQAWYAATSGSTYALAELRHNRSIARDLTGEVVQSAPGAEATLTVTEQDKVRTRRIPRNTSLPVDLFLASDDISGSPVSRIRVAGRGDPGAWVEVRWVGWLSAGVPWISNATEVHFSAVELEDGGRTVDLRQDVQFLREEFAGAPNENFVPTTWRVQIVALYGDLHDIEVTAISDYLPEPNAEVPIPAHLSVRSAGSFRSARQNVVASFPLTTALNDVFNFVLFSEEQVVKE